MLKNLFKPLLSGLIVILFLAACAPAAPLALSNASAQVSGDSTENSFALSVAQFVMDSSGFHGMASALNTNKKIDSSYAGTVNRAYKVLSQTIWPQPLAKQGQSFTALLKDFGTALTAKNVDDAIRLSDQVHDAQHELSQAIDDWFSKTASNTSMR
jgi:hypothetical protein